MVTIDVGRSLLVDCIFLIFCIFVNHMIDYFVVYTDVLYTGCDEIMYDVFKKVDCMCCFMFSHGVSISMFNR